MNKYEDNEVKNSNIWVVFMIDLLLVIGVSIWSVVTIHQEYNEKGILIRDPETRVFKSIPIKE